MGWIRKAKRAPDLKSLMAEFGGMTLGQWEGLWATREKHGYPTPAGVRVQTRLFRRLWKAAGA